MNLPLKLGQPRFLSKDEVLTLHRASLNAYGGADGFLNEGSLDSALAQTRQGFGGSFANEFPFGMAAAYGYHIAMNHAFRDGNKRTAFAAVAVFLRLNGWDLELPDEQAADLVLEMIEHRRDKAWLSSRLERGCRPRLSMELRDFFSQLQPVHLQAFREALLLGGRGDELLTSLNECQQSMPVVARLVELMQEYRDKGELETAGAISSQLVSLLMLYRIAEDMGYEW